MFLMPLTQEERDTLVKLLTTKVREIHAWRIATKSRIRDEEYEQIASLLKNMSFMRGD